MFITFVGFALGYVAIALLIAVGIFKFTRRASLSLLAFMILLVAPVHEGVFGYPTFREFDAQHPGVQCEAELQTDGVLIDGRRASSPSEALNADALPSTFRFKELPREMVESMKPVPRMPLDAYVQFFLTTDDDPACTQRFDSVRSQPNCVGVTSSAEPRSEYAVFMEPDERAGRVDLQLNDSKLFPIVGSHTRVREVKSNRVVAEEWQFVLRSKVVSQFVWFHKRNPPGGAYAALCLASKARAARNKPKE